MQQCQALFRQQESNSLHMLKASWHIMKPVCHVMIRDFLLLEYICKEMDIRGCT